MSLLENGRIVDDIWVTVDDDAALPDTPAIISLDRLRRDAATLVGRNALLGVAIGNDVPPDALTEFLPHLSLVQVALPKSKDGRAFTQIRALREYYGFKGDIRVVGHVIADHYAMLLRCGASSVMIPAGADPAVWEASRHVVSIAYQHAQSAEQPLALLRRRIA